MKQSPRNRGVTLVELLFAIMLLAAMLGLIGRFYFSTFTRMRVATEAENAALETDQMLSELARDTWSAIAIESSNPSTVVFRTDNSGIATWHFSENSATRESAAEPIREWSLASSLGVTPAPGGLNVRSTAATGEPREIRMISQLMIQRGGRP